VSLRIKASAVLHCVEQYLTQRCANPLPFCVRQVGHFPYELQQAIGEALLVAFLLAFVPYLLIRGPANRIARRFAVPKICKRWQELRSPQ
jgi:hypothetical protein